MHNLTGFTSFALLYKIGTLDFIQFLGGGIGRKRYTYPNGVFNALTP